MYMSRSEICITRANFMNRKVCDEKIDCSDIGSRPGAGRPKRRTEKCFFCEKKRVDRTTLATRTKGRPC